MGQCELAFATGSETLMTEIFPWLAICVKKLFDFRKYCDKPSLSQYFSGKPVKSHIVNRFLFASIGYIVSYWTCFVILAYCQWTLFAVAIAIKVLAIACSFDMSYDLRLVDTTKNATNGQPVQQQSANQHVVVQMEGTTAVPSTRIAMRLTSRTRRGRYTQ